MIKAVLIDDNAFIATVLKDTLTENHPDITILGTAKNGTEGIALIKQHQPDLVFLDIEMPDMTGFEMLSNLASINFQTIFTTAHSHYAIKAFRFNALDYLVKPVNKDELAEAIGRFKNNYNPSETQERIKTALDNLKVKRSENQVLLLNTQQETLKIPLKQIVKIEGDRNYSYIHLTNNNKELSSKTLGFFEEVLSDKGFLRCHRSYLVNRNNINTIDRSDFLMKNLSRVPISRRKMSEAKNWFY